jgi:hypothetical protein
VKKITSTDTSVIKAPHWLVDRMKAIKQLPPPTIDEVLSQWRASDEFQWRRMYEDVDYIK